MKHKIFAQDEDFDEWSKDKHIISIEPITAGIAKHFSEDKNTEYSDYDYNIFVVYYDNPGLLDTNKTESDGVDTRKGK